MRRIADKTNNELTFHDELLKKKVTIFSHVFPFQS